MAFRQDVFFDILESGETKLAPHVAGLPKVVVDGGDEGGFDW